MMDDLRFWSEDRRFGLRIPSEVKKAILGQCQNACKNETGGILIGEYTASRDCAIAHRATGPPADSVAAATRFRRGTAGINKLLRLLWRRERHYYLGEWHFHPGASPYPSEIDDRQLRAIAEAPKYRCPEPILLIVGGNPAGEWDAAAFVFDAASRKEMALVH